MTNSEESVDLLERLGAHDFDPTCQFQHGGSTCPEKAAVDLGWTIQCCGWNTSSLFCRDHHNLFIEYLQESPESGWAILCKQCQKVTLVSRRLDLFHLDWSRPL